jgi:hypothetical protein
VETETRNQKPGQALVTRALAPSGKEFCLAGLRLSGFGIAFISGFWFLVSGLIHF